MKSVLLVYQDGRFLNLVNDLIKSIKNCKCKITTKERDNLSVNDYKNKDIIIIAGGDGTFLRASHFNKNLPMLGINPDPKRKEGFFMQTTINNYKEKLDNVLKDNFKIKKLLRLNAKINGKKITEICLNEFFIGDAKPYNMFNYDLTIGNKTEFQRGSGLLIGTPAGSYAWLKSAKGKVLKLGCRKWQFIARELYEHNLTKNYQLEKGILNDDDNVKILIKTPGILVMDSVSDVYELKKGDIVDISVSRYDLKYVDV